MSGATTVALGREALWGRLSDPEALGAAVPGVEEVHADGDRVRVRALAATGLGVTPFELTLSLVERRPPTRLVVSGAGSAPERAIELELELELEEAPAGTEVAWTGEVALLGVVSSIGQRALQGLVAGEVARVLAAVAVVD